MKRKKAAVSKKENGPGKRKKPNTSGRPDDPVEVNSKSVTPANPETTESDTALSSSLPEDTAPRDEPKTGDATNSDDAPESDEKEEDLRFDAKEIYAAFIRLLKKYNAWRRVLEPHFDERSVPEGVKTAFFKAYPTATGFDNNGWWLDTAEFLMELDPERFGGEAKDSTYEFAKRLHRATYDHIYASDD